MKKTQKTLLLVLCGALCAIILSCASSGGSAKNPKSMEGLGTGTLAVGEWFAYVDAEDGGDSTCELKTAEEVIDGETITVHSVKGNVTTKFQYGFAGWGINPDDATLELIKSAKALSFTILGDGKRYAIKFKTSDVRDYAYHEYLFNTEEGVPLTIEVPMGFFIQPSWTGDPKRLKPENVVGVEWQTHESWRPGTFEIKTWGFKIF
jgi:hypothetical protein